MELIIKPTGRCNFACTFCSAGDMNIQHPIDEKVPDKNKELLNIMKPTTIIITGGEPLMMDPNYYYELHNLMPNCSISPTTNLKDFYLHPDKWAPLFNEEWFRITTSFNYGDSRKWDKNTVFTEDMFIKVIERFKEYVPNKQVPMFIAVIDDNNEDTVMDHILLAKRLGTVCKMNRAIGVGFQSVGYQRYKIMKHYLDIIDAGLSQYEWNCANRTKGTCPYNINHSCESTIRCVYLDNDSKMHIGTCDEKLSMGIEVPEEKIINPNYMPEYEHIEISDYIKPECVYCELFNLCNGCGINRKEAKLDHNYCDEMKKLESRIIDSGWAL